MQAAGVTSFYKIENGNKMYYDINAKEYKIIPGTEELISLANLRDSNTVWNNSDVHIIDLGDGILNVEFHTKMNTIGAGVLAGINEALDLAEQNDKYTGVVISNEGSKFLCRC